jgi:hypothetical protein
MRACMEAALVGPGCDIFFWDASGLGVGGLLACAGSLGLRLAT